MPAYAGCDRASKDARSRHWGYAVDPNPPATAPPPTPAAPPAASPARPVLHAHHRIVRFAVTETWTVLRCWNGIGPGRRDRRDRGVGLRRSGRNSSVAPAPMPSSLRW